MCGRYYVDDDTAREIEKLVRQVDEKLRRKDTACRVEMAARDIHPTDAAPILVASGSGIACLWQRWGFPGFQQGQVIFNARCESTLEKSMFREGILHRRVLRMGSWQEKAYLLQGRRACPVSGRMLQEVWGRGPVCDPDDTGKRLHGACS